MEDSKLDHETHERTISRRLVANGLHSCRPLKRLPLTPPNRRQSLEWCRARSTWMTEWHRVVFSDESRFCLSSDSRRVRVWRRRGERSNPAAIVERPTVRQRGIMVWGAIAYDSRSPLLRIQGTMTAQRYVDDVLRPVTLPYLQGVPNDLYQQDNARPHTARISQQALQNVQMLPWPPYSPDLSPIEHVWDIIGRRLHALPQRRSEDELWQMLGHGGHTRHRPQKLAEKNIADPPILKEEEKKVQQQKTLDCQRTLSHPLPAVKKEDKTVLPPCQACKMLVTSFKNGLKKTARNKYDGGDTAWEESRLGSYSTSEVRLVEIEENLCSELEKGKHQCHQLLEENDSILEEWWKGHQDEDLFQYLCIERIKVELKILAMAMGYVKELEHVRDQENASAIQNILELSVINVSFCANIPGSYKCLHCDKACESCNGDGPDMCLKCAEGFTKKDSLCVETATLKREFHAELTRYATYLGLCVATIIIFRKNIMVASVIGLAVAMYISLSEYTIGDWDRRTLLKDLKSWLHPTVPGYRNTILLREQQSFISRHPLPAVKKEDKTVLPPCQACKMLVTSFKNGLKKTARNKYDGGDTAWEESRLGSYSTSEVRLVEIEENLCSDLEKGKHQCHQLLEENDSILEEWWKGHQDEDLFQYLCIERIKVELKILAMAMGYVKELEHVRDQENASAIQNILELSVINVSFCANIPGSYKCLHCDKACESCNGDGPDMCLKCAEGFTKKDSLCVETATLKREFHAELTRYATYLGLCVATIIIFRKNIMVASVIGLAVAMYISLSEYTIGDWDRRTLLKDLKSWLVI
ncbi:CRELD2 [Cordylochernes scorpioides]|uniref:CRELD2 n=1 Tax=Cordylochernes scorpioides TaxID=51811 RepID=A0ABY6K694_9ARAC|nr:CRELD2 [Cordylochernes scorpioides]